MLKVGENLYLVPNSNVRYIGEARYIEIEKVGRKFIYFKNERFKADSVSLEIVSEGCASPGHLYKSKEDWEAEIFANKNWRDLRLILCQARPNTLTSAKILEARKILGF